jgi:hypothetical protein
MGREGVDWIQLACDRAQYRALENTVVDRKVVA